MKREQPKYTREQETELRKNPINEFICSCQDANPMVHKDFMKHLELDAKPMVHKDFMKHLELDHKINTKDKAALKGTRKMLMHMDGPEWYSSSYQWELESGLKFTQYSEHVRDIDDPMRYC